MVRLLARVIGVGIETADMLVQEVLARNMRDRRAVARYAGPHGLARRERHKTARERAGPFRRLGPPRQVCTCSVTGKRVPTSATGA